MPCAGAFFCTLCGDGICKNPENLCNCPEDCQKAEPGECDSSSDCPEGQYCETFCGNGWCSGTCLPVKDNSCIKTGCSSQICALEPVMTTCEYLPWYACLAQSECGPFGPNGECAWKQTQAYLDCLGNSGGGQDGELPK